ncbi:hypothetical protein [Occallatibacter riparius]|uniref:Uncharacterized protein n=1 Tax=Occallatibacter riparius TaxID=1002689 RepID=A0A9J7BIY1_9BACT|nr:hypothetical protein [Occallatibacter riparius]UWZ82639.1 hypothetical protein MOP44_18960 [Occallatibacter riparius]
MLQISDDPDIAVPRVLLLESAGFVVEHCTTWQVRTLGNLDRFDVFFFCQSIDPQSAGELAIRIRREAPRARILRVRAKRGDYDHLANLYLHAPTPPEELLHAMQLLVSTLPPRPEHGESVL